MKVVTRQGSSNSRTHLWTFDCTGIDKAAGRCTDNTSPHSHFSHSHQSLTPATLFHMRDAFGSRIQDVFDVCLTKSFRCLMFHRNLLGVPDPFRLVSDYTTACTIFTADWNRHNLRRSTEWHAVWPHGRKDHLHILERTEPGHASFVCAVPTTWTGVRAHLHHAQAGHSHPVLRHLVVGPGKRVEHALVLAIVFCFFVKTMLALIAAYPELAHIVALFPGPRRDSSAHDPSGFSFASHGV